MSSGRGFAFNLFHRFPLAAGRLSSDGQSFTHSTSRRRVRPSVSHSIFHGVPLHGSCCRYALSFVYIQPWNPTLVRSSTSSLRWAAGVWFRFVFFSLLLWLTWEFFQRSVLLRDWQRLMIVPLTLISSSDGISAPVRFIPQSDLGFLLVLLFFFWKVRDFYLLLSFKCGV